MPLIPRPGIGGIGDRSVRNVVLGGLIGAFLLLGVLAVFIRIARQVLASGSPLAPGVLFLGLGFVLAVFYGITRDSSIAMIAWFLAMAFGTLVGGQGLLAVDRVAFMALAGTFFIEVVTGRRELGRLGVTEFLMLCFVIYLIGSSLTPHALPAVGEKGEHRSLVDLILTSAFLPFAGFFMGRQILNTERNVRRFLWFITVFGVYLGITNVFWVLHMKALIWPKTILDPNLGAHFDRGRGVFLNAAVTGLVLVVCFIVTMYLASRYRGRMRYGLLAAALLMLIGIGLTQTRSAWLAAVLVILFSAAVYTGFRRWYLLIILGLAVLVGINWSTFTSKDRAAGGVNSVNETQDRLNAAATGLWAIQQKPILGWGLGRFPAINTVHHRAWGTTPWKRGYGIYAHDTQIGIGAELGLLGLGLWLMIIVSMVVASRRAWKTLPRSGLLSRNLAIVFWSVAISWGVTASLIDVRLFAFANTLFFVFGGMCAGLADEFARRRLAAEDEEPGQPSPAGPVPLPVLRGV